MDRQLKSAYGACARLTRREAKNFFYAFAALPKYKRWGISAVYAFCRQADDIADGCEAKGEKRARLHELRVRLEEAAAGRPGTEFDVALSDTIRRFSVGVQDLTDVLAGVEIDLTVSRYGSYDDLVGYCHLVASAVGLAIIPILARRGEGSQVGLTMRRRATAFGVGMQLVNVVRDVAEDIDRDRVYLPQEDLDRFAVTDDDLRRGKMHQGMRDLFALELRRAKSALAEGMKLVEDLPRSSRGCPAMLAAVYSGISNKIEKRNYDVFSKRVRLGAVEKIGMSVGAWARSAFG